MKKYLKKIVPFVCVLTVLVCSFAFSVGASNEIINSEINTFRFKKIHEVTMYSNMHSDGLAYTNVRIPSTPFLSYDPYIDTSLTAGELCVNNYTYLRMNPNESSLDYSIKIPVGSTFEMSIRYYLAYQTCDRSQGVVQGDTLTKQEPIPPGDETAGKNFARMRMVNEDRTLCVDLDLIIWSDPNSDYLTYAKLNWVNRSGETMYLDYIECGAEKVYPDAIFTYTMSLYNFNYRVLSGTETMTQKIEDTIDSNFEETQKFVKDTIEKSTKTITDSISDSTDKITNGWTPKPEKPQGSEEVDDYIQQEEELKNEIQGGIDKGNEIIDSLSSNLLEYGAGFAFIILLFDRLNFSWLNTLMNISLTLGVSAFLLNIAPSITRGIGRLSSKGGKGKKGG